MDHTGVLPWVMERVKPGKIFASPMGMKTIKAQSHQYLGGVIPVKTRYTLDLSNKKFFFACSGWTLMDLRRYEL